MTCDGIQLEESPATQGLLSLCNSFQLLYIYTFIGLYFWKSPRRKLYAVLKTDLSESCASSSIIQLSDSDDADFMPRKKKKKENKMDIIISDISDIKRSISEVMSLSSSSSIPIALRRITRDTFKCSICFLLGHQSSSRNVARLFWDAIAA